MSVPAVTPGVAAPALERQRFAPSRIWAFAVRFQKAPLAAFWVLIGAILVLPILLFLVVAVSPRLFDQGNAWFSLSGFREAFTGQLLHGVLDSLGVGIASAVAATGIGLAIAWIVVRTNAPMRRLWSGTMFALLLTPSYLIALGWERLLEPSGVLDVAGLHPGAVRSVFYGPFGVILVLTMKGLPFAYLAVCSALRGLGEEFESAARVHGGKGRDAARIVVALLAPAVWSAMAIVFAESVSDFGVAATLANDAHFPVATYTLYNAVESFPVRFPVAAAIGWVLLAMAGLALLAQSRATRGRSYRVLGGRSRPARQVQLTRRASILTTTGMTVLVIIALGVPAFGAVSASLLNGLGSLVGGHGLTLSNYSRVISSPQLRGPLLYSAKLAAITATAAVAAAVVIARVLTARTKLKAARLLDLLLLTAVALPGIVFAAGYIFTYNLPLMNHLGIHLYETTTLLVLGYLATALPTTSRVLFGTTSQLHESLHAAARVHGSNGVVAWLRTALPLLARPLISAWVLTFAATLLELPISQLLYPPNHPPVSVGITKALANYDFGGGTAMEVLAVLFAGLVVAAVWGLFRLLAPIGWRQLGKAT